MIEMRDITTSGVSSVQSSYTVVAQTQAVVVLNNQPTDCNGEPVLAASMGIVIVASCYLDVHIHSSTIRIRVI